MRSLLALIIALPLGWLGGRAWQNSSSSSDPIPANCESEDRTQQTRPVEQTDSNSDPVAALTSVLASVGKDSMHAKSQLYKLLQRFTAEDFQRLTRDPSAFAKLAKPAGNFWTVRRAVIEGFLERWIEVDQESAFAWYESGPALAKIGDYIDDSVVATFTRSFPDRMLAHVLKMPAGDDRKMTANFFIQAIAATDLAKAKKWVERFDDKSTREIAEIGYRLVWARTDPFGSVAGVGNEDDEVWRAAMEEAARRGTATAVAMAEKATTGQQILVAAAELETLDPALAARLILTHADKPPVNLDTLRPIWIARELAVSDLEQARAWAEALPGEQRTLALGSVAQVWAASDPRGAIEWLSEHPAGPVSDPNKAYEPPEDIRIHVFRSWLGRDETAARSYASSLPAGETRAVVDAALISCLNQSGRTAEAAALFAQAENPGNGALASKLAAAMANDNPIAAATWATSLPPGPGQTEAVKTVASTWAGRDPISVASWIEQFPAGKVRDRAVAAYAQNIIQMDPSAAAEWTLQIEDPWDRGKLAQSVFWQMRARDRQGAERWFENLPGIDETIRRTTLLDAR
ncbi:MAG: hypothetical protein ABI680_03210 [Chthoniobacteraceae bacterium]